MLDKIKTILEADATINDEVNFIGIETIPQKIKTPYIVLGIIDGEPSDTKNTASKMDIDIISINTYSETLYNSSGELGAYVLQQRIEAALDTYSGTVGGTELYVRKMGSISTFDLNIPNSLMKNAECEYQVYVTKI